MTLCTTKTTRFARGKGRQIQVNFNEGEITSDAGAILFGIVKLVWLRGLDSI